MLVELSVVKEQGVLDFLIIKFSGVPMQSFCFMGAKHPDQNLQDGAKSAEFGGKFTTKRTMTLWQLCDQYLHTFWEFADCSRVSKSKNGTDPV